MSFSFSRKSSVKINQANQPAKKADPNPNAAKKTYGAKTNPILTAKTEEYVDDAGLYQPRVFRADRLKYFDYIMENWKDKKRKPGRGDDTWISEKIREENDEVNYPQLYVQLFHIVRSNRWDQIYLDCFVIFLVLCVFFYDGIAKDIAPSIATMQSSLMMFPLIIMLICAAIPCLGTAWFVHYGYDLVHYSAAHDFQQWVRQSSIFLHLFSKLNDSKFVERYDRHLHVC